MDAYLRLHYMLELTDKEMRLICLGLAGKIKGYEDTMAAHELNLKLLKSQQVRLKEQVVNIEGAIKRATEEAPQDKKKVEVKP